MVELNATIQMQPIMMRARFFDNCNFKGHQIARNLHVQEEQKKTIIFVSVSNINQIILHSIIAL